MPDNNNNYAGLYSNRNIVLHEFIGLKVRVSKSSDANKRSLSGTVINETKNTLVVRTRRGPRSIPKKGSVFAFAVGEKRFTVDGAEICFTPEERIEKALRFYKKRR